MARIPMVPGEIFTQPGEIEINVGRKTKIDVATFVSGRKEIVFNLRAASWFI